METSVISDKTALNYNNALKIKDALQIYFSKYHFEDGGYLLKWFKIKIGPLYIPFPNIKARVDAVKIHDIHHILTEYTAELKGEAEIGGWEIGSGCGKYFIAWLLNFATFFYGMLFFPKPLFNAFMRGRKCDTNLYSGIAYNEDLLNRTVGELRIFIGIDVPKKNRASDYLLFIFYCLFLLLILVLSLLLLEFVISSIIKSRL